MNGLLLNDDVEVSACALALVGMNKLYETTTNDSICLVFEMVCQNRVCEEETKVGVEEDPIYEREACEAGIV